MAEINYLNLPAIYGAAAELQSMKMNQRLNQMKMAEYEKDLMRKDKRNALAKDFFTAGAPAQTINPLATQAPAPTMTGGNALSPQYQAQTSEMPGTPARQDYQGYSNALMQSGDTEGGMAAIEQGQAVEDKAFASRMTFIQPQFKALIDAGDNAGLKSLITSMKADPVISKRLPPGFDMNIGPQGEMETVTEVKADTKDPRTGGPLLDPYTRQPIAPGMYKFTAKNGQLMKVDPYKDDVKGVTEPALAIRAAKGDKEAQSAFDYLAKKRASNQEQVDFKNESSMRKEFQALPEVKEYPVIDQQGKRAIKALEDKSGNKIAVDQSIITIFNKMLDPSSVVRESEYARTPQDMAMLNRIKGKWEKLSTGGAGLTDDERQALQRMIIAFKGVADTQYNEQVDYYSGLAKRYGYSPENVVRLGGRRAGDNEQKQTGSAPDETVATNPQTGQKMIKRGGIWQAM